MQSAKFGVIGGSEFASIFSKPTKLDMNTRYGKPSDLISVGSVAGRRVVLLQRHGKQHTIPPHRIPYKANIEALKKLGVERVLASAAVGSLRKDYKPGELVILDQFINMTSSRDDTFFHEAPVTHISTAYPYCRELRSIAISAAKEKKLPFHENGTVVVINGPRFSSKAESNLFKNMNADVINMTMYPEIALAREREMCYLGIALVTDYDAGIDGAAEKPVSLDEVNRIASQGFLKLKDLMLEVISIAPSKRGCDCGHVLDNAVINP